MIRKSQWGAGRVRQGIKESWYRMGSWPCSVADSGGTVHWAFEESWRIPCRHVPRIRSWNIPYWLRIAFWHHRVMLPSRLWFWSMPWSREALKPHGVFWDRVLGMCKSCPLQLSWDKLKHRGMAWDTNGICYSPPLRLLSSLSALH